MARPSININFFLILYLPHAAREACLNSMTMCHVTKKKVKKTGPDVHLKQFSLTHHFEPHVVRIRIL